MSPPSPKVKPQMADISKAPSHRLVCKATDRREDRYENIGVAWAKKGDDGRTIVSIKFNPFLDPAKVLAAASVLLVPAGDTRTKAAPGASGNAPDFGDDDIPF